MNTFARRSVQATSTHNQLQRGYQPRTNKKSLILTSVIVALAGALGGGCAVPPPVRPVNGGLLPVSARNFVRDSEKVTLKLIKSTDQASMTKYGFQAPGTYVLSREEIKLDKPKDRFIPLVSDLVDSLVGVAVDAVKSQLAKEAARHEQQFSQQTYADDFWTVQVTDEIVQTFDSAGNRVPDKTWRVTRVTPNYAGFVLIREATGFASPKDVAFEFATAFVPAKSDPRLITLQPTYLRDLASAARVSRTVAGSSTVTINVNAVVQNAAFDKDGKFSQPTAADASFKISAYDLANSPLLQAADLQDLRAGYFLAPLPTGNSPLPNQLAPAGVFKLFVAVTETDDSKAQEFILKFSEFVGAQKEGLIAKAKDAVSPPNP